jgi:hypothetical protein
MLPKWAQWFVQLVFLLGLVFNGTLMYVQLAPFVAVDCIVESINATSDNGINENKRGCHNYQFQVKAYCRDNLVEIFALDETYCRCEFGDFSTSYFCQDRLLPSPWALSMYRILRDSSELDFAIGDKVTFYYHRQRMFVGRKDIDGGKVGVNIVVSVVYFIAMIFSCFYFRTIRRKPATSPYHIMLEETQMERV